MTEMSETEKKRVAEQRELLGEEGLNSKRQRLEKATEDNEVIIEINCKGHRLLDSSAVIWQPLIAPIYMYSTCNNQPNPACFVFF